MNELNAILLGGPLAGFISGFGIVGTILSIGYAVITYYLYCVPQEKIAAKLGNKDTWQAYVPIARNIQRVNMTGMPLWKFLFVGGTFTALFDAFIVGGITFLCALIHAGFGAAVGIILSLAVIVLFVLSTYQYRAILAEKFGFEKAPMALTWMFMPGVSQVITYIVALSDRYYVGSAKETASKPVAGGYSAAPVANNSAEIGLECISGSYAGAKFTMSASDEFTIGRDSALSNIIISAGGDKVSRRHCSIKYITTTGCYEVTDFSSNGTFYGNTRLLKGSPTSIPRGTTLIIGDKLNQFKLL